MTNCETKEVLTIYGAVSTGRQHPEDIRDIKVAAVKE